MPKEPAVRIYAATDGTQPFTERELGLKDPTARARIRARNGGLAVLAEAAHLNREHLYRMLSENGNPELRSLEAVLDALGFRLSIELKAAG